MKLPFLSFALAFAALSLPTHSLQADEKPLLKVVENLAYKSGDSLSDYEKERCKLDLYLPAGKTGFATLVWFHGGGITSGSKDEAFTKPIVRSLAESGIAVASVSYRLSPKATYPAYVDDSAAAVAYVYRHIAEHGGDATKVYVGGHSAGGYLIALLAMDERYLQKAGMKPGDVAGYIPVSAQLLTHYTIRDERGEGKFAITADEAAPIHYARKDIPPMLVLYAEHDMASRLEENQFFTAVLRAAGNKTVKEQLIKDRTHGSIASRMAEPEDPAKKALLDFMKVEPAKP